MSTLVLTLVVVGGSVVVAARFAGGGDGQPATEAPVAHRAPDTGRRRARRNREAPVLEGVPARPGLFVRLRAGVVLVVIVGVLGALIAVAVLGGAQAIGQALETAVE